MSKQIKDYLGISIIAAIILSVIAVFWFAFSYSDSVSPQTDFSVSAEGEVVAVPDVAEVTAEVITEGGTDVEELQQDNTEKMNNVIEYIKSEGVADEDIETAGYSISPRYQHYRCPEDGGPCPPSEIVGYTVRQNVDIKIRDFSKIGTILEGSVREGANTISGLSFTIDDPTEARNEARQKAIEKAKDKAQSMASQAGFSVGRLVSINENVNTPYYPVYERAEQSFALDGDDSMSTAPSVEPGSQEVKVNITLTYEIK